MKNDILNAVEDMKSKVERDSKHIYRNAVTGDRLQGVTSVSSILPKEWLASWGAKEAVKALGYTDYADLTSLTKILETIKKCSPKEYLKLLKEAKGAHTRKSKTAMGTGKDGHSWLENFVKARISGSAVPTKLDTLLRPLTQFEEWSNETIKEYIASECFVTRLDKYYAGQLDAIAVLKNDKLALIDFKFSTNLSEEYYLQTAGYAACFEPYSINFDERIIVRLPKTTEREEWNEKTFTYEMKPNNIEVKVVPTNYVGDREAFFAGLQLKGWSNQFLKN